MNSWWDDDNELQPYVQAILLMYTSPQVLYKITTEFTILQRKSETKREIQRHKRMQSSMLTACESSKPEWNQKENMWGDCPKTIM